MKITEEQLDLAYLIAEFHDPLITEGGCDFRAYSREWDSRNLPELRPSKLVIAILEDYQKKPRVIGSFKALAQLPVFSVIRSATGGIYEKNCMLKNSSEQWWEKTGSDGYHSVTSIDLPATVLSEGEV